MFTFPIKNKGLLFEFKQEKIVSLHMFFVFYPIDVLFLDKKRKIVELIHNFRPFTPIYVPKKRSKYVIEVPKGSITRTDTKVGDLVSF
jgi:hypothetical protein